MTTPRQTSTLAPLSFCPTWFIGAGPVYRLPKVRRAVITTDQAAQVFFWLFAAATAAAVAFLFL